ncbi:MAG TPA: deaminase [archaeon]|nr:deaminase [archaeon]
MTEWSPKIQPIDGDIHKEFLRNAYLHASTDSQDLVTKNAVIIVSKDYEIIAYGANHFPSGVNPTEEQIKDREWKYKHIIHSEQAAIFSAAKQGKSTYDTVMYEPWVPCTPCAKAVIDAGVKKMIGHKELIMQTPERWWTDTDYALGLLEKAGVEMCMYSGKIGGVENLFNGLIWQP